MADKDFVIGCGEFSRPPKPGPNATVREIIKANGWKPTKATEIKNRWLLLPGGLGSAAGRVPPERLLFVVDDPRNIEDVRKNCPGTHGLLIEDSSLAMTEAHATQVIKWAAAWATPAT